MPVNMKDLTQDFLSILREHADNLEELEAGFGVRLAAYPKGLMPYKDAQRVVASFEKDTQSLQEFIDHLPIRSAPPEFKKDLEAMYAKANKALQKFKSDRDAATKALEQHEDLLVGEYFQKAFEKVRLDILDLDPVDDVDLDYKTEIHPDATPSYAEGFISIKQGDKEVYKVTVGYQAATDYYYGNLFSAKKYKTFAKITQKEGHAFLPRFSKELVSQLKALADSEGIRVFKSRKKVELQIVDPSAVAESLRPALDAAFTKKHPTLPSGYKPRFDFSIDSTGKTGSAKISFSYFWETRESTGLDHWTIMNRALNLDVTRGKQKEAFNIQDTQKRTWSVTPVIETWQYKLEDRNWSNFVAENHKELQDSLWLRHRSYLVLALNGQHPAKTKKTELMEAAKALTSTWRYSPDATTMAEAENALRTVSNKVVGTFTFYGGIKYQLALINDGKKTAAERVAKRWVNAGANGFSVFIEESDSDRAFREAKNDAMHEYGHGGYTGTIAEKRGYTVRYGEPFTNRNEMTKFVNADIEKNDKWESAFAVAYSEPKVLKKETVTVSVAAKHPKEALRKGIMAIKATGRVPPGASILVDVKSTDVEVKPGVQGMFEVTGTRSQAIVGKITGWMFYGYASS